MATPTLDVTSRLDMIPGMLTVGLHLVAAMLYAPFRGSEGAKTFDRHVQNSVIRALTTRMNVAQLQYIRGTSSATFSKWTAGHPELEVHTDVLAHDAKIHWIGTRIGAKVLFHIHGGGYILPLSVGHLDMLLSIRNVIKELTGQALSIAMLEYTTSPSGPYPTQFRQANVALTQLFDSGIPPSDIIISGDSAGAHIALCVLSHILHPYPSIEAPPRLTAPFAGVLLISPRVTCETAAPSFNLNSNRDTLTKEAFSYWISNFRANSNISTDAGLEADGWYTEPMKAPEEWWNGFSTTIANRMFISAGNHECLRDTIITFSKSMKNIQGLDCTEIVEECGIHDSPLMDVGRPPSELMLAIHHWLAATVA